MLKLVVEIAIKTADVRAGSAHVEADDTIEAGLSSGHRRAHDAPGRSAEEAVLGPVIITGNQAAGTGHDAESAVGQLAFHAVEVACHDRRQVGIDDRRFSARQNLDDWGQIA